MTSRYKLISETKLAFLQRAGKLIGNGEKRYTTRSSHSRSQSRQSRSLIGLGYIIKIGTKKIGFNFSIGEVRKYWIDYLVMVSLLNNILLISVKIAADRLLTLWLILFQIIRFVRDVVFVLQ